ncbi:MAG: acyltransferase [Bacteroidales bacterium]|nr:acyltransferase [Bacteroidales bacterium]
MEKEKYRADIDGLRAIAIITVIIFHYGFLPNGYLGVDIFFVISGFLITKIIFSESEKSKFSLKTFYIRRTRRIIPLVTFFSLLTLVVGIFTMLPDDLENLSQSIVATTFFSNNILQLITTGNYYDVVNEFKPLMHTWSLGIEEQFYMVYPLLFLLLKKDKTKYILPVLIAISILSVILFLKSENAAQKFYLLQYRFFELSIGGIGAIIFRRQLLQIKFSFVFVIILLILLIFPINFISSSILLLIVVLFTLLLLISDNNAPISAFMLKNTLFVLVGKISFSLYMWHQVVLAFGRYIFIQEMTIINIIVLSLSILILSIITYLFIETPFRNKDFISVKKLVILLIIISFLNIGASFYIYQKAGVLKDIPELDISKKSAKRNMHAQYNADIYNFNKDFTDSQNIKVLCIGNSYARDWVNVLLESKYKNFIDLSYIYSIKEESTKQRIEKADIVFVTNISKNGIDSLQPDYSKIWCVGTKNFGVSNGIFYNNFSDDFCFQKTRMENRYYKINDSIKFIWKDKYIDIVDKISDSLGKVPVFTPDCKFISQDCRHLTEAGAKYFATLFDHELEKILSISQESNN